MGWASYYCSLLDFDGLGEVHERCFDSEVRKWNEKGLLLLVRLDNDLTTVNWLCGLLEPRLPPLVSSGGKNQMAKLRHAFGVRTGRDRRTLQAEIFYSGQKWPDFSQMQVLKCVGLAKLGNNISGRDTTAYLENFHLSMFVCLYCLIPGRFWFYVVKGPE